MNESGTTSRAEARGLRQSREIEGHLAWLDSFTGTALGVLSVASGIYTYLGVSSLLGEASDTRNLAVLSSLTTNLQPIGTCVGSACLRRMHLAT